MMCGFLNLSLSKIKESFRAIAKNLQVFVEANYSREDPSLSLWMTYIVLIPKNRIRNN